MRSSSGRCRDEGVGLVYMVDAGSEGDGAGDGVAVLNPPKDDIINCFALIVPREQTNGCKCRTRAPGL